jgi:hypothetical protein
MEIPMRKSLGLISSLLLVVLILPACTEDPNNALPSVPPPPPPGTIKDSGAGARGIPPEIMEKMKKKQAGNAADAAKPKGDEAPADASKEQAKEPGA